MSALFISFEGILSRTYETFEEQNKVSEPSIIIINYCIIIINAYHNYIITHSIITFVVKASYRNAIRKKMWQ